MDEAPASEPTALVALSPPSGEDAFIDAEPIAPAARSGIHHWGVSLDVGAPDGATMSLVARPLRQLEVAAGISYNGVSNGGRGEITWTPLDAVITPTLSVVIGHYEDGDANPLARLISGNPMFESPLLDRVGYDYQSAQVGFELGRRRVSFYLRAGVSHITGSVHGIGELAGQMTQVTGADPAVTIVTASARLGLVVRFAR